MIFRGRPGRVRAVRTVLSQDVWVHYGQLYMASGPQMPSPEECFGGQRNGLCGAAARGFLFLITGLHAGEVSFEVELGDQAPLVDERWQEIVEVSFQPAGEVWLAGWAGEWSRPLDITPVGYRVRYSAAGMDEGHALDTRMDDDPAADRYLLQLWPAPPQPDTVIRQTSQIAAYWHQVARHYPPPPTPQEKAAAEQRALAEQRRQAEGTRPQAEERDWGGRLPSQRLRRLRGNALNLAEMDRPLVEALAETSPGTQRQVARWVTRRAFTEAQLAGIGWIAPALAAMDNDKPLPPPFDTDRLPWDLLHSDKHAPSTTVTSPDGRQDNYSQQAMAFPAILSTREQDPLRAAVDALWSAAAAFGHDRRQALFSEVRQAFPSLANPRT